MNSVRGPDFDRCYAKLPLEAQKLATAAYRLFRDDPFHSGLQFKQVNARTDDWSVRIGLHYRALGRRYGENIVWYWIGTHAEYDQILRRR